ncbi:MAG: alanine dehydrogenase [Planctomycetota bacterium]|jgi:alanine dehydrogenase|nr:alanine dehydrogenase [Planctomycetota bacterium]
MKIGVPTEIKPSENRVAMVPAGADRLVQDGHQVFIQKGAGDGSGIDDQEYVTAGATILPDADAVFESADMIMKVKEPIAEEYGRIRKGQLLFTYFHFAASLELTDAMVASGSDCIAYETVELGGTLPLLTPMSEVAGRMSVQEGAKYLEKPMGGRGVLLGGVPGVEPGRVLILGGGIVGVNAAKMAAGLGAHVTIMDIDMDRLRYLADVMPANVTTRFSNRLAIQEELRSADLVIGAVLVTGEKAPSLVTREDLALMPRGAVIADVAVDQGGCIETIKPTTHLDPVYTVDGVVHYAVANMPGAVPRTSTFALTNVTLPYARRLAGNGLRAALEADNGLALGANVMRGAITHPGVAKAFDRELVSLEDVLA